MTTIVAYLGKVPRNVIAVKKLEPQYRSTYAKFINDYQWLYVHQAPDSSYNYCIIRPARSVGAKNRGVFGTFKLNEHAQIASFKETFNTPILEKDSLVEVCKYLWEDLMHYGHVDRYLNNKDYIEFPGIDTQYDTLTHSWIYKSPE